jgi:hypothetical protein
MEGIGFKMPVLNVDMPLRYSNPDVIYKFPLTDSSVYADSFRMNFSMQGIDILVKGHRSSFVDGYGKITTPYGTFDCIRLKSRVLERDSFMIPFSNNRTEYTWLAKGQKIPILQIIVPDTGLPSIMYKDIERNIINPLAPIPAFSVNDSAVQTGDTVKFINQTTTGPCFFTWNITPANYTYVNKTDAATKDPEVIFSAPGIYTVSLNASVIAGSNTVVKKNYISVSKKTGIAKISGQEISIYPNPVSNILHVNTGGSKLISIQLFDSHGLQINCQMPLTGSDSHEINLDQMPAGIYLLKLQMEDGYISQTVIKY